MRKRIVSSHLALRFYKQWWTLEELLPYLKRGELIDLIEGQGVRDYYFLDHRLGSQLDVERLYADLHPDVFDWRDMELFGREAIRYLKEMNN